MIKVPKYVEGLMNRAEFYFDDDFALPGHTLSIKKRTPYQNIESFKEEIERLSSWIKRSCIAFGMDEECVGKMVVIHYVPDRTRYAQQKAVITVLDPIMKFLEPLVFS